MPNVISKASVIYKKKPALISWSDVHAPRNVPIDINLQRLHNNEQWVVAVTIALTGEGSKIPVGQIRTLKSVPIRRPKTPAMGYIVRLAGRSGVVVVASNSAEEAIDVAAVICPEGALTLYEQYKAVLDETGEVREDTVAADVVPLVDRLGLRLTLTDFMKKARADIEARSLKCP